MKSLGPHSAIEPLEARIAPAATVTFAGGLLTISGDADSENVTITESATPGEYTASGLAPGEPTSFSGVTGIVAKMGTGVDQFTYAGNGTAGTGLKKNLTVSSAGQLQVSLTDGADVAGTVSISQTGSASLTVSASGGGAGINLGALTVKNGAGNNTVTLSSMRVVKNVAVDGGSDGSDIVSVGASVVSGAVSVTSRGPALDQFFVTGSHLGGALKFVSQGDNCTFAIQSASSVRGAVTATLTGTGGFFNLQSDSFVLGSVTFNGGAGNETMNIDATVAGSVTAKLGDGNNTLNLSNATQIGGNVTFTSGIGSADLDVTGGTHISGGLSLLAPKSAVTTVDVTDSYIAKIAAITSGAGSDPINLTNSSIGGVKITAGAGADVITFNGTTVRGSTSLSGGLDADAVRVNNSRFTSTLTFAGGAGNNGFRVESDFASDNISSYFLGAVSYQGGAEDDTLLLGLDSDDLAIFNAALTATAGGVTGTNTFFATFALFVVPPKATGFI